MKKVLSFAMVLVLAFGLVHTSSVTLKAGETSQVELWHYFEGEEASLIEVVNGYNESQDDIEIVPTFLAREELMNQYTIGAVSGELPDLGQVDSPDMASYISLGVFADIDDYLRDWEDLEHFYEGPLSSCLGQDGRLYGLPNNSNCLAILCNMEMLRAAGFESGPTTWEELEEIAAATTDAENDVYGFAMCASSTEEGTFQIIPWLYGAGGTIAEIDSPEAIESFTFLGDLVNNGYMSNEVANWSQGDAFNAWVAQKAAMVESGTWQIALSLDTDVKDDVTWDYEYVPMPANGDNQATVIGGENFGVCSGTDYLEECVEFLTFMMSAQNNADWCEISGKLVVRDDAVELKEFWTADPRYKVFNDSMVFAVPRGPHPQWPTISEAIRTAQQATILGQQTPEEAAAKAAEVINPIIEEIPLP